MSLLTAEVLVSHRVFTLDTGTGRHGSAQEGTLSAPIARFAYQVYPKSWGNPRTDVVTPEIEATTKTEMLLDVPDPTVYKRRDTVEIQGVSYVVQGRPENWGDGLSLLSEYDDLLGGGTVLLQRVD